MNLVRRSTPIRARLLLRSLVLVALVAALTSYGTEGWAKPKPSRVPRPEPELKILQLDLAPTPYQPGNGPLAFTVTVQLPKELNGATMLEVSSLISSPSKTSLRFLAHRQPVELPAPAPVAAGNPTLSLRLLWDGQDHRKQIAGPGAYSYEVRIKLLGQTEKGLRTMMVAWPRRGTVEVK